jgi:Carboxypeptidase regulatory-like domain/TonB-dependent Receptor Plug Domain
VRRLGLFSAMLTLLVCPGAVLAQQRPPAPRAGVVRDARTGDGVAGARVEVVGTTRSAITGDGGGFTLSAAPGTFQVRVLRLGYATLDTTVTSPGALVLVVREQPIELSPLTVRSARLAQEGAARERELFREEPVPGVIGIGSRELHAVPPLVEPDVMRALQALPGVSALNDLSADLHVRGGGDDQNLVLLDGARILAPFHLFGMFGAFNADAVGRVNFYRGALPARYGGALSSVVDIEQWRPERDTLAVEGGVSLLGARATAKGTLPFLDGEWLLGARRSVSNVGAWWVLGGDRFPYGFHDVQGRVAISPAAGQRLRLSFFESSDRLRTALGGSPAADFTADWRNLAGSLRWDGRLLGAWVADAQAWGSAYRGGMVAGLAEAARPTRDTVTLAGGRIEVARRGERTGARLGAEVEAGDVALVGSGQPDSYIQGGRRASYVMPALYAEVERWIGKVRLAPGLRAAYATAGHRWLLEPRLAVRTQLPDSMSLTLGLGRTHQILSTVRDDRYLLPGPPLWLVQPDSVPTTVADGVDAAVDGWLGRLWSYHVGAYARRLGNVARWRPVGTRELSGVAYDDGSAVGLEFMLRRHGEDWSGWIGYGLARVRFDETATGTRYYPAWDRRHSVDVAAFWRPAGRLSVSARATYASGGPFWPVAGAIQTARIATFRSGSDRVIRYLDEVPIWARGQYRLPDYFRLDLSARWPFRIGAARFSPYLSVINASGRNNVLYYGLQGTVPPPGQPDDWHYTLVPIHAFWASVLPTVGLDVRF